MRIPLLILLLGYLLFGHVIEPAGSEAQRSPLRLRTFGAIADARAATRAGTRVGTRAGARARSLRQHTQHAAPHMVRVEEDRSPSPDQFYEFAHLLSHWSVAVLTDQDLYLARVNLRNADGNYNEVFTNVTLTQMYETALAVKNGMSGRRRPTSNAYSVHYTETDATRQSTVGDYRDYRDSRDGKPCSRLPSHAVRVSCPRFKRAHFDRERDLFVLLEECGGRLLTVDLLLMEMRFVRGISEVVDFAISSARDQTQIIYYLTTGATNHERGPLLRLWRANIILGKRPSLRGETRKLLYQIRSFAAARARLAVDHLRHFRPTFHVGPPNGVVARVFVFLLDPLYVIKIDVRRDATIARRILGCDETGVGNTTMVLNFFYQHQFGVVTAMLFNTSIDSTKIYSLDTYVGFVEDQQITPNCLLRDLDHPRLAFGRADLVEHTNNHWLVTSAASGRCYKTHANLELRFELSANRGNDFRVLHIWNVYMKTKSPAWIRDIVIRSDLLNMGHHEPTYVVDAKHGCAPGRALKPNKDFSQSSHKSSHTDNADDATPIFASAKPLDRSHKKEPQTGKNEKTDNAGKLERTGKTWKTEKIETTEKHTEKHDKNEKTEKVEKEEKSERYDQDEIDENQETDTTDTDQNGMNTALIETTPIISIRDNEAQSGLETTDNENTDNEKTESAENTSSQDSDTEHVVQSPELHLDGSKLTRQDIINAEKELRRLEKIKHVRAPQSLPIVPTHTPMRTPNRFIDTSVRHNKHRHSEGNPHERVFWITYDDYEDDATDMNSGTSGTAYQGGSSVNKPNTLNTLASTTNEFMGDTLSAFRGSVTEEPLRRVTKSLHADAIAPYKHDENTNAFLAFLDRIYQNQTLTNLFAEKMARPYEYRDHPTHKHHKNRQHRHKRSLAPVYGNISENIDGNNGGNTGENAGGNTNEKTSVNSDENANGNMSGNANVKIIGNPRVEGNVPRNINGKNISAETIKTAVILDPSTTVVSNTSATAVARL